MSPPWWWTQAFIPQIDFRRKKYDMSASVKTIEYDPNRNARIAPVEYEDGENVYSSQQD